MDLFEMKNLMNPRWSIVLILALVSIVLLGCASTTPSPITPSSQPTAAVAQPTAAAPQPTVAPPTTGNGVSQTPLPPPPPTVGAGTSPTTQAAAPTNASGVTAVENQPIPDGPILLRSDMSLRKVAEVGAANVRIALNPRNNQLYMLHPQNGVYTVDLASGEIDRVINRTDVVTNGNAAGMTFGPDGSLYIVFNQNVLPKDNRAVIRKGTQNDNGEFTWTTLAQTEPYPLAGNNFDHLANGIAVSPDGQWVYYNSGSRSDHGEIETNLGEFPNVREVPLTSAVLRIPANSQDLIIPADETALKPYLYADGTRNAFDPEFAPNGDLFVGDNGPDADFPDELNWIREGQHYGFPWKFGIQDNPQQFPDYSPLRDNRLDGDFFAVENGLYANDKTFPPAPAVNFAAPVVNRGPDATVYRADDGSEHDAAAEGQTLNTFTPHRSPLGLTFATDESMPTDLRGDANSLSALVTSWGAAAGTLSDRGADVLHMRLTKNGDNYEAVTNMVARNFNFPIDGVLIGNKYYLLEWGEGGNIWEITFGQ